MIHSNSLFHFTKKEYLLNILQNNFIPRYSKERFNNGSITYDYWVPMVAFCDIPLSQIGRHIDEYGKYAIGLKRNWALENKLNPVQYYNHQSTFYSKYNKLMSSMNEKVKKSERSLLFTNNAVDDYLSAKYLYTFFKPYQGYDFKLENEKTFYEEREWRFVRESIDFDDFMIPEPLVQADIKIKNLNEKIIDKKLIFEPKDISCIIIEKDEERLEIVQMIKSIKGSFPHNDVEVLSTKILSIDQILSDM